LAFIIRIYRDAQSCECQKPNTFLSVPVNMVVSKQQYKNHF